MMILKMFLWGGLFLADVTVVAEDDHGEKSNVSGYMHVEVPVPLSFLPKQFILIKFQSRDIKVENRYMLFS